MLNFEMIRAAIQTDCDSFGLPFPIVRVWCVVVQISIT